MIFGSIEDPLCPTIFMTFFLLLPHPIIITGITIINHDTMSLTEVAHCLDPGCDPHPITYRASEKQMNALIGLSQECSQSISVNILKLIQCFFFF